MVIIFVELCVAASTWGVDLWSEVIGTTAGLSFLLDSTLRAACSFREERISCPLALSVVIVRLWLLCCFGHIPHINAPAKQAAASQGRVRRIILERLGGIEVEAVSALLIPLSSCRYSPFIPSSNQENISQ